MEQVESSDPWALSEVVVDSLMKRRIFAIQTVASSTTAGESVDNDEVGSSILSEGIIFFIYFCEFLPIRGVLLHGRIHCITCPRSSKI
jgi:hypothetical protein